MSVRLRLGNNLKGDKPAMGVMKNFRAGVRLPSSYSYKTLPLGKLNSSYTGSKSISVDEVKRYFDRDDDHEPRMTTGATMFAGLRSSDGGKWYSRPEDEVMSGDFTGAMRTYGESTLADESIGMTIKLYRLVKGHSYTTTQAYFDNALFKVSNVLWEFSADGGDKWYQLYDLPNRAYTRVSFPRQTTRIRARALSNSLDEWVQSFAITPKPDLQKIGNEGGALDAISLSIDKYGYMRWNSVKGGNGNVRYVVQANGSTLATTRVAHHQLKSPVSGQEYFVYAKDEVGNASYASAKYSAS